MISLPSPEQQKIMANALRVLSMDAVQKANSGHPGMPMGMAEIAMALWQEHLVHNPANPQWINRDRFVLSNGHGSMLLYALLHLSGYDLSLNDLQNFRQLHSKTPGHPEYGITPGVETTTGPLGQGLANAVGMALAESLLAGEFNRPQLEIIKHYTYVFVGDGCLMEGISHEAASLAGTWGLSRLIVFYDDNGISIDGAVEGWFTDNTPQRFQSYAWQVIPDVDGHNPVAVSEAIRQAKAQTIPRPTLICCKTTIGRGAPTRQGTAKAHGEPLGAEELAKTKTALAWEYPPFVIPQDLYEAWDARPRGRQQEADWQSLWGRYQTAYPKEAIELVRRTQKQLPADWLMRQGAIRQALSADILPTAKPLATRKASQQVLSALSVHLPELIGGSADLMGSVFTNWSGSQVVRATENGNHQGNIINFGVREFAMAGITNGLSLHGGFIPLSGTFLTFSDYSRNALRMAALMRIRNIFVFTHDSIGLGEDGPTHQPVEHVAALRLIPHLHVWRPADVAETMVAWQSALLRTDGPTALILSRQTMPNQTRKAGGEEDIMRGGYIIYESPSSVSKVSKGLQLQPELILMATGSELDLVMKSAVLLEQQNIRVRVVSMPCTQRFDEQELTYREAVLPPSIPCVVVEAGVSAGWWRYLKGPAKVLGVDDFGASAPAGDLFRYFGLTVENIVAESRALLGLV